jgi:predicted nucleotidyltransferase
MQYVEVSRCFMIYSLEQIKELVVPIAEKYKLNALWVFGSYARSEATEESDVDLLLDFTDSIAKNLSGFIDMADEFEATFGKKVDKISTEALKAPTTIQYRSKFVNALAKEKVILYEKR